MIASVAYALIVTGMYVGSLAPGVDIRVQFRAEHVETLQACQALGTSLRDTMARYGATRITVDCVPKQ